MSIGDGYVHKCTRSKSCLLCVKHSTKQNEYILYKKNLLESLGCCNINLHYIDNNGYSGVYFTKADSYFRCIRKWLYKDGKKVISRFLLDKLTPEGIAIWYMDDGNLSAKKRNGKVHAYELFLNTHTSKENNQIIIDYFLDVWNVRFHQVKNKGSYRLRMSTREIRRFLPIFENFVIPSMNYKINMQRHECGASNLDDDIV